MFWDISCKIWAYILARWTIFKIRTLQKPDILGTHENVMNVPSVNFQAWGKMLTLNIRFFVIYSLAGAICALFSATLWVKSDYYFLLKQPTGPIQPSSRNVCLCVPFSM